MSILESIRRYDLTTKELDDLMKSLDKDLKFFSDYLIKLVKEKKIPQEYYQKFFEDEIVNLNIKELIDNEKFNKILLENWLNLEKFMKSWYDEKLKIYIEYVNYLLIEWANYLVSKNDDIDMIDRILKIKEKYKFIVTLIPSWYKAVVSKASEAVFSVLTWWRK